MDFFFYMVLLFMLFFFSIMAWRSFTGMLNFMPLIFLAIVILLSAMLMVLSFSVSEDWVFTIDQVEDREYDYFTAASERNVRNIEDLVIVTNTTYVVIEGKIGEGDLAEISPTNLFLGIFYLGYMMVSVLIFISLSIKAMEGQL